MKNIILAVAALATSSTFGQNIVCFDIEANPTPDDPALALFTKYIDVFGIGIFAESSISDEKVKHTAAIFAEWIDNDEDGVVDDPLVYAELIDREALMPIFSNEGSPAENAFFDNYEGEGVGAVLYEGEIITTRPLTDQFDATLEENLHTISSIGYANAYPLAFAEGETDNSFLTVAMDTARGGHFVAIPGTYPESAWYHYNDETCEYNCMATEYFYWGLTSMLGIQNYGERCDWIAEEWEACTATEFEIMDTALFNLFSEPLYNIPTSAPDGNYCPDNLSLKEQTAPNFIKVSPNPASSIITIQLNEIEFENIVIYNQLGSRVHVENITNKTTSINIEHLPLGVYYLATSRTNQKIKIIKN